LTFRETEASLIQWMAENARVCRVATDRPRELEAELIRTLALPLNPDQNKHAFCATLRGIRTAARTRARDARDTRV